MIVQGFFGTRTFVVLIFIFIYSSSSELSKAVYGSLCNFSPLEEFLKLASRTAFAFVKVVERQPERYLPGGELSGLEPDSFVPQVH